MNATTTAPAPSWTRYSPEEQAAALVALAEHGGNVAATSRDTGIPEQTLRDWRNGVTRTTSPESVAEQKARRAARWDALQEDAIEQALAKLPEASARDAAVVAGIATDKAAMLRGETAGTGPGTVNLTVNVNPVSVTLTPDDIAAARQLLAGVRPVQVQPIEPGEPAENAGETGQK